MSISGKKIFLSTIAAIICIVLYFAALCLGTGRIIINSNHRGILAEREFQDIVDRATSAAILGFMSQSYQEVIQDSIIESETLLGVIISGSHGEFGFERQSGSVINLIGNSPRFRTGFGISRNPYFRAIRVDGQRNTTVQATYSIFDFDFFVQVLKDTLIIVLLIIGLAIITLLVEIKFKPRTAQTYEPSVSFESTQANLTYNGPSNPKGLYSSRGIGWELYTKERLESELHRCSASEEDLVFIMIEPRKAKFEEDDLRKLADEGVANLTERDLIFEKGEQGMTLIIPTLELEQGLTKSEQFRRHIRNSMIDDSGYPPDLRIGMSSRAGRLVEADRLILEASEALSKAINDLEHPIVAFKSDPEKYREFIKRTGIY